MAKVNITVSEEINKYFKEEAEKLGVSKSYLMELALREQLLKEMNLKKR